MAQVDDYLRHSVMPQLRPGEQIVGMGLIRRPSQFNAFGIPQTYEEWLATATGLRLILFRTQGSGLHTVNPSPMCLEALEWWYQDLARVELGAVGGIGGGTHFTLFPREGMGPLDGKAQRYDMFPRAENLDGHMSFVQNHPRWLAQMVGSGAFPLDAEGHARAQAAMWKRQQAAQYAHQQQAAQAAQQAADRARRAAAVQGFARSIHPIGWFALAVVLSLGVLGAIGNGWYFNERAVGYARDEASAKDYLRRAEDDYDRKRFQQQIQWSREGQSHQAPYVYGSGAGAVVLLGGAVFAWLGWRKRHAAASATG